MSEDQTTQQSYSSSPTSVATGFGISALVTTGVVSACVAFSGALLYFHYFPQTRETPPPVAVVDMIKLAASITKAAFETPGFDNKAALVKAGESIAQLREAGYVVLDARYVISTPEQLLFKPSDLVPGLPEVDSAVGGYVRPSLDPIVDTPKGGDKQQ